MKRLLIGLSALFLLLLHGCYSYPDPTPEIDPSDTKNQKLLTNLTELKKACDDSKDAVACYKLGDFYRISSANKYKNYTPNRKFSDNPRMDYSKSHGYYSQSCWLGYSPGCVKRAERYISGVYLEKHYPGADYSRAAKAFGYACDGKDNNVDGCKGLCRLYLHIDIDYSQARKYCKKACDLGDGISCDNIDLLFYQGQGDINKTPAGSIEYYNRLCNMNDTYACMKIGHMYREGKGVTQDYLKASKYYRKACNLNDSLGCASIGYLYREGQGVTKDHSKAMFYFNKSCNVLHSSTGCALYGHLKRQGY